MSPLVSVLMITYNHEQYIRDAIEGVLLQKTTFPIELVIGEDCSTDKTRSICIEYQKKYPDIIRLILNEKNLGAHLNLINVLSSCNGKYIALCEGDDYWTNPNKLQIQIDFLENNPDYVGCCHNVYKVDKNKNIINKVLPFNTNQDLTLNNLALQNTIPTLSLVFKNDTNLITYLNKFKNPIVSDYIINLYLAKNGKIKYLNQIMGNYRFHESGVVSSCTYHVHKKLFHLTAWVDLINSLKKDFPEVKNEFNKQIFYYNENIFILSIIIHSKKNIKKLSVYFLKKYKYFKGNKLRLIISSLIGIFFPKLIILKRKTFNKDYYDTPK